MARNTKRSAIRGRNRTATGSSRASRNGFHTIRKSPHDQRPQNMEAQHSGAPLQRNQGRGRPQRDTDARCRRSREGRVPFRGDQGSGSSLGKGGSRIMPPAGFDPTIPLKQTATLYRSEEHTSELQSLMRISYAVFCLKKKTQIYI